MERASFQTMLALERGPRLTREARLGALVSTAFHLALLLMVTFFSTTPVPLSSEEAEGGSAATGYPRPEIIELDRPFYAPPPEVIRQLAGIEALRPPRHPEFLSERTTVARGEPNPNPMGSSSLPKVSGRGRALPELIEERPQTVRPASGASSKGALADPRMAPTLPAPGDRGDALDRRHASIPESVLAAIRGSSAPPGAEAFSNPQSGVTLEGPPSVNAQAVAAMEEYRAYLERAIQQRWFIPPEANLLSAPATVTVVFEVGRDGRLLQLRLRQSSGIPALDRAAINAVRLAAPFRPLPSVYPFESQWFTDRFIYYPPR
jgi:TonB family protein